MQTTVPIKVKKLDDVPLVVHYEITGGRQELELNPGSALRLVTELSEFDPHPSLNIFGDDSLRRGDILDLLELAADLNIWTTLDISGTAWRATPHMLRNLQRAGLNRGTVRLDGPDSRLNDALTGIPGSFNLSLAFLRDADPQDLGMEVHTVLTRHNISELNRMASLLSGLVLKRWNLEFFVPESKHDAGLRARPIQIEEAFEQIWEHAIHCPFEVTVTEAPHFRRFVMIREHNPDPPPNKPGYEHFRHVQTPMNDGRGEMFVAHDGAIYPGLHLPIEAGRFPEQSLAEVYRSEVFTRLRDCSSLRGKCRACDYVELCGGSRARAFAITGNEFSSDPDCLYVPEGWKARARSESQIVAA